MSMNDRYDAVVIGGGPSGSTAASVLAGRGRSVIVLEKEKFPRYHIGESLLPYAYFTLERIGMLPKMKSAPFVKKYSVQFVRTDGSLSAPFYFHTHLHHEAAQTWQVLRSEFDQMLLDNARERGAEVREQTTVRDFIVEDEKIAGVKAVTADGERLEYRAPITIDASGRESLAITRNNWRMRDPFLNKIAVWTYYRGAQRDPGIDEGATTVAYVPEKGWFWYIPLHNDLVSVGVVAERDYLYSDGRDLEKIFHREVNKNLWIKEHVAVGRQEGPYRVTGEYSYRSRYCATDGLLLTGDAFAFLDPVFSSGVFLALRGGELAGETAHQAIAEGDVSAKRFHNYGQELCRGIESMRRLVYAFYDQNFSFGKMLRKHPNLKGDITDCLIGNLWMDFDPLFRAVEEFAGVPAPLEYGRQVAALA